MKNLNEIEQEAKKNYQTFFKESKNANEDTYRGHDIVLDKVELEKEMELKKENEEKKIESLEVLRNKLNIEAEESLKKTFGMEKAVKNKKRMNTQEMYEELNSNKEYLMKEMASLKEKQMKK